MSETPATAAGQCSTCRHWDQQKIRAEWRITIRLKPLPGENEDGFDESTETRQRAVEARYGECGAVTMLEPYERFDEAASVPVAFCKDGSGYMANLYTRDDFGCALWEAAPVVADQAIASGS